MTPTVVFDTFGYVAVETNNVVPAAYALALVVMGFTAISYGKMVGVIPSAGSAYTYVRESMHPSLGFLVGWTSLMDYLLLPMVNCLIIRLYMESMVPDAPPWVSQLLGPAVTTVPGETVPGPGEPGGPRDDARPSSSARMTIPGEAVEGDHFEVHDVGPFAVITVR